MLSLSSLLTGCVLFVSIKRKPSEETSLLFRRSSRKPIDPKPICTNFSVLNVCVSEEEDEDDEEDSDEEEDEQEDEEEQEATIVFPTFIRKRRLEKF